MSVLKTCLAPVLRRGAGFTLLIFTLSHLLLTFSYCCALSVDVNSCRRASMGKDSIPHNSSDDEKVVGGGNGKVENIVADDGLPPDPDAGLSDEERAAIVSPRSSGTERDIADTVTRTAGCYGSLTSSSSHGSPYCT